MFNISRLLPDGSVRTVHFRPKARQGVPKYPIRHMDTGDFFFIPDYMMPKHTAHIRLRGFREGRELRFLPAQGGVYAYCERVHGDHDVAEEYDAIVEFGYPQQESQEFDEKAGLFRRIFPARQTANST